ncbi:hypothetical protein KR018_005422 [Drosophila ironensis]|nr:hypothetical protein KR018_005422 [Drosophila ironensis]
MFLLHQHHSLLTLLTCALAAAAALTQEEGSRPGPTAAGPPSGPTPALPLGSSSSSSSSSKQLNRCRQSCHQQLSSSPGAKDWHYCKDSADCMSCCQKLVSPFELRVLKAQRQESLVLTDIGWNEAIANASRQCLITWEVSGGGLIGNLLTDTPRAELSLWPDTVYNVQVKCKHKLTGMMRRSIKLNVDTSQLVGTTSPTSTSTSTTTTTTTTTTRIRNESPPNEPRQDVQEHSQRPRTRPTDRVYIISALPTPSELGGVVYPAFGALAFFLALLVMFLFLRPQRKRFLLEDVEDIAERDTDRATLIGRTSGRNSMDASTLHV